MDKSEILTNVGVLLAGIFAGLIAYFGKSPPKPKAHPETVVAGIGMELGNRLQADEANAQLKRIADSLAILADRKQATTEAKLDRILQELDEAEEREREQRAGPPLPRARQRQRKPRRDPA